tara:strand:+ start:91 stop:1407 length:1317 start_codon:yes stop_codon:yes gene_type:complete
MLLSSKIYNGINGNIKIPGDKSISHRSIIIPSISNGISEISNLLMSKDVQHTLNAFKLMGVEITTDKNITTIYGKGLNSLKKPEKPIYLGNSGTSARLLTGLLSNQKFNTILEGDKSLSKRPMKRITYPLSLMGGQFESQSGTLPLKIIGNELKNIQHKISIPSAQIKSGLILAALNTIGKTEITEENITRNHTETMLKSFGAKITTKEDASGSLISILGKNELISKNISVPSDLSSAAFFIVAALINENSKLTLEGININPTRDGILRALKLMGAKINIENERFINEEKIADLTINHSKLKGCELDGDIAKLMIDEFPILAVAASFAKTPSKFYGLKELRVKESDRLELIRHNLENCGIHCEIEDENLFINPNKKFELKNNIIKTDYDHRIAMAFAVMGSKLGKDLKIEDEESIHTSFPNFTESFNNAGGKLGTNIE